MLQDLRYGIRMLARSPGFTAVAALTLAVGIGSTTAIFSVVWAVLLRPLPFAAPDRLIAIWEKTGSAGRDRSFVSPANFQDWREQAGVFSGMAAIQFTNINLAGGSAEPEEAQLERVSPELFGMLGVRAAAGRTFRAGEERERIALVSHQVWVRRFGADPNAVGASVRLNDRNWTVVGILPPGFHLINREVDLWLPLALEPAAAYRASSTRNLTVLARLKAGVPMRRAETEMRAVAARLERDWPRLNAGWTVNLLPLHEELVGDVRRTLLVLLGAVGLLLTMSCANVANLLLARAAGRQREMALRSAVGAPRGRLVRQLLAESLLLAAAGGAAGVALAWAGVRALPALGAPDIPRLDQVGMHPAVLGFSLLVSFATGIAFGLAPALDLARVNIHDAMREGGRSVAGGRGRLRGALVAGQVALALVLLIGAGLAARSFARLRAADPGLQPDNLLTMRVMLPQRDANEAERAAFFRQALERVRTLPGVQAAGAVNRLPLSGFGAGAPFAVEGRQAEASAQKPVALVRAVDPEYFRAAGIPLLRGRGFTAADGPDAPRTILVSQALAQRFWPSGEGAVGARLRIDFRQPVLAEVIGVTGDVRSEGLHAAPWPMIYYQHAQFPSPLMSLVVRTAGDPAALARAAAQEIHALAPNLPVAEVRTMREVLERSLANPRFDALLLTIFGAAALALATVGVYGVMAYHVSERRREIGIRMAMGAQRGAVLRLVMGRAARLAALGIAAGLGGAFAFTRALDGILYGVDTTDLLTFVAAPAGLAAVALLAAWLPAHRATGTDPLSALREE